MSNKQVYWFNLRKGSEQEMYVELNQISKGRWKVTLGFDEFIIKSTSQNPLDILHEATRRRQGSQ